MYNLIFLVLFNITLAIVAGILFRKHIIAPYFNPQLRWWETEPRYKMDVYSDLTSDSKMLRGEILDISNSGFLLELGHDITLGKIYTFSIQCMRHLIKVQGRVMRRSFSDEEYNRFGIMFVKLTAPKKNKLNAIIEYLERGGLRDYSREKKAVLVQAAERRAYSRLYETASRYTLTHNAVLTMEGKNIQCQVLDISRNGCFIKTGQDIPLDSNHTINLRCMKMETAVKGRIEWKTMLHGLNGYGVKFMNLTKGEKRNIDMFIHTLKKIGAQNRLKEAQPVSEDVIDKGVINTPYKIVLFFKKLLLKDIGIDKTG